MVELAVGLVVIMVLLAGLIQIGHLTHAHTETMIAARDYAGQSAMASSYDGTMDDAYIFDWMRGGDDKAYTIDDIPFSATNATDPALDIASVAHADELATLVPDNDISEVQGLAQTVDAFFLVHGHADDSIDTFPVIRSLIYNRTNISTESDAWLVWTEGLY